MPMFSRALRALATSGEEVRKILLAFFSAVLYQLSYLATVLKRNSIRHGRGPDEPGSDPQPNLRALAG